MKKNIKIRFVGKPNGFEVQRKTWFGWKYITYPLFGEGYDYVYHRYGAKTKLELLDIILKEYYYTTKDFVTIWEYPSIKNKFIMKKNKKEVNIPEKKKLEIRSKHSWTMKAHLDENGIKTGDWDINIQTPIQILNASDEDINHYFSWIQDAMAVGLLSMIDIMYLVKSTPNDKELGEKIRSFFYNAKLLPSSYNVLEEYHPNKEK